MECEFTIRRSDEWIAIERLKRGENVPKDIRTTVDIAEMAEPIRQHLLQFGRGSYKKHYEDFTFDGTFSPNPHGGYGRIDFRVDSDNPTVAEVGQAIEIAWEQLNAECEEKKQQKAERAAKQAAKQKEAEAKKAVKAAEEAAKDTARELLASELIPLRHTRKERNILADFLREVPLDALRGAIRAMVDTDQARRKLQEEIEEASPVWIFANRDEEEEDDDDDDNE